MCAIKASGCNFMLRATNTYSHFALVTQIIILVPTVYDIQYRKINKFITTN